jgi:hypothetical protein
MSTPARNTTDSSVSRRRGPRYRLSGETPQWDSESLRFFRALTDGLSNRLPLPSVEAMRAGTVNNPVSLMRRLLFSMRSAGLPKERALRVAVWVQRQVDCLWPMEQTPLRALEEKAMRLEHVANCSEKKLALEYNAITLRERIQAQSAEVVADMLVLAKLERELEDAQ